MGAKKIYTLQIDGITKSISDTTKLEDVLNRIETTVNKINQANQNASRSSRQRSSSLTEEEKAAKKLADTQDKATRVITQQEKAQVQANQQLRERTQALNQQIRIENAAEGSIKQLGAQLTQLRTRYENLSRAQREDVEVGGELLQQIQALDKEYKALRESTGNFRDSVGNYEKATSGLNDLTQGVQALNKTTMGLVQTLLLSNQLLLLFGDSNEENAKRAETLQKILLALSIVQTLNNNVFKQGIAITKSATIAETLHAVQVRARATAIALSTKNTIAATVAQKAFNLVATANPYVLLATALVAVVGALVTYNSSADKATETTKKYKSSIDDVTFATKEARDAHDDLIRKIRDIQIEIDVANGKLTEYEAALLRIGNNTEDMLNGAAEQFSSDVDEIYSKVNNWNFFNQLGATLGISNTWYEEVEIARKKVLEREKIYQDESAKIQEVGNNQKELENAKHNATVLKQNQDNDIALKSGLEQTLAQIQRARDEANEIAKAKNEKARKEQAEGRKAEFVDIEKMNAVFDKQEAEARKEANKKASDESKARLQNQKAVYERELALIRKAEDDKTALIDNEFERRRAEVNQKYARQRADLQRQLNEDKTLTQAGREAIQAVIANIDQHIAREREKIRQDELAKEKSNNEKIADDQKTLLDIQLSYVQDFYDDIQDLQKQVRGQGGLIDVEATRKNINQANEHLSEYILMLNNSKTEIEEYYNNLLKLYEKDSIEYKKALREKEQALRDFTLRIKQANDEIKKNTEESNDVVDEYYKELFDNIRKYANAASEAITSVLDTFSMGLEFQLESLNEQLDAVNERYEEAKQLREDSAKHIEELEKNIQNATGGTREALKEQLQDEMHQHAELEREEARLAKEKERREAEIAKKEKRIKRNDLISNIAQATANVAQGVTKAWSLGPIVGPILAAIVGTAGFAQIGIMTRQLTKLEDGGLINAPLHSNGGARIQGTNIEVEGGEYVINRRSTAANKPLIDFINNSRSTVTASDLAGIIPDDIGNSVIITELPRNNNTEIIEAIENINFQPEVSVVEIIDVQENVVKVRENAGF